MMMAMIMPAITDPPVTENEKTTCVNPEPSVDADAPLNRR